MAKIAGKIIREKDSKVFNLSNLVLGVLILLTLGVTYNFYKSAKSKDIVRFSNQVSRLNTSIENRIKLYTVMLKGSRGFIETTPDFNLEKFALYVNHLDLPNRYPGIQGIGFVRAVKASDREALINKIQAEGNSTFKIFPEGERDYYYPVVYVEPSSERNRVALGFDVYTETSRREALMRSLDTGEGAATGKVMLLQQANDNQPQTGFLIFMPIYSTEKVPLLQGQRAENLTGFVYSPFLAKNFLSEIYDNFPDKDIKIRIYDREFAPENLIVETGDSPTQTTPGLMDEVYTAKQEMDVAGRKWILEFTVLPNFAEQSSVGWTPLILLCGIGFSFLIFGLTYWEAASRAKMQRAAAKLYELQKEKEQLFEDEKSARLLAEQANVTKDEFIAIVSHELKTPLNAIAGWTRILKTAGISNQTKELALQKIDKNLRAQAGLVEQLLDYSEVIAGNIRLKEEPVVFSEVFEQAYREIEPFAAEKQIKFIKENLLDGQIVKGDRERLKMVIGNLLSNAVKFTPGGGRVEVHLGKTGQTIELTIKDNGRGISAETLPQIFESYKQADTPNTRDYGGLGLGLTISKHIVNLHNGTIKAESGGQGKGSIFTVSIPFGSDNGQKTY